MLTFSEALCVRLTLGLVALTKRLILQCLEPVVPNSRGVIRLHFRYCRVDHPCRLWTLRVPFSRRIWQDMLQLFSNKAGGIRRNVSFLVCAG